MTIDANVGGDSACPIDLYLESILTWTETKFGSEQLVAAKEEFFWKTGKVFCDDELFNSRMTYFLDFFIFQRPLELTAPIYNGATPFQAHFYFSSNTSRFIDEFRHSLFQVLKIAPGHLIVRDVISEKKLVILKREDETFSGIEKNNLFQGFIYICKNGNFLSHGLIFHPERVHKTIKKFIKSAKIKVDFSEGSLLARTAKQQLRHFRHLNIDPRVVYNENP